MPLPPAPPRRPRLARLAAASALLALAGLTVGGCEIKSWLAPQELVDPKGSNRLDAQGKAKPRVQPILGELDLGVTRVPVAYTTARDVAPGDLVVQFSDYQIGPGDEVRVSIKNFQRDGSDYLEPLRVSDTGLLNLPDLPDPVRVTGQTESQAARTINDRYVAAGIFQIGTSATSLLVLTAQNRTFGILGNVPNAGRFLINRSDFRLLDAYTLARGTNDPQTTSDTIYIIRPTGTAAGGTGGNAPRGNPRNTGGTGDPLQPRSDARPAPAPALSPAAPIYAMVQNSQGAQDTRRSGNVTFTPPRPVDGFEIIRVPLDRLLSGDLNFNVVIRPDDTVYVPAVLTGEYYVGGHVTRPGVYAIIPGRKLTIKQAIISAGMLDEVAIPGRTQLIRRINDQECFVRVDLSKIFTGQQPDVYLQANDQILVGTNLPAPFLATFRNAFRITYGFGFLYDRNFAYDNNGFR